MSFTEADERADREDRAEMFRAQAVAEMTLAATHDDREFQRDCVARAQVFATLYLAEITALTN